MLSYIILDMVSSLIFFLDKEGALVDTGYFVGLTPIENLNSILICHEINSNKR
jgi:hypothetical protein